jgi:hypothetical protein
MGEGGVAPEERVGGRVRGSIQLRKSRHFFYSIDDFWKKSVRERIHFHIDIAKSQFCPERLRDDVHRYSKIHCP